MNLADKEILVTGASGFIGSQLVERLGHGEGARVRALVRKAAGGRIGTPDPNIRYVLGDITNKDDVAKAAAGCHIIVHTAACQPFAPLPAVATFAAVNVGGTANLLEAFRPGGEGRFLLLSTINVHGLPPPVGANAESPLKYSGDRYSDSKVDGERAAWQLAQVRDIPLTVIRPACTFGPKGAAWTLQPLERLRRGTPVLIGAGRGICNPIYVDNLIDLIVVALKSEKAVNASFIGSQGEGMEWREFYDAYARMLGIRPKQVPFAAAVGAATLAGMYERISGRPAPISPASVAFYTHRVTFNAEKNARLLGFKPRVSVQEGMQRTQEWLRREGLI